MAETAWKRTFKIKNFSGEDEDEWRVWSSKMIAFAHKKGYYDALVTVVDLDVEETADKNREAISDLTIACDGEAWEIIQDMDSPDPTAYDMWQALRKQFQPVEIDDYIDLSNRFKKCEMETEFENPRKWIRRLQRINRRLGDIATEHRHSDVEMAAEIFLKLPATYSEFVTSCNLGGAAGNGTLTEITKDLERFFKRTVEKGETKNDGKHDKEQAFLAIDGARARKEGFVCFAKAFKGLCNKCGKQGHKGVDCRVRPENYVRGHKGNEKNYFKTNNGHFKKRGTKNTDKSNMKCFNCNKVGHFARDCRNQVNNNNIGESMFVGSLDYAGFQVKEENRNHDQMEYWLAYMHESDRMILSESEDEDSLYGEMVAMAMDKSIKEAIAAAEEQLLIDVKKLKNCLDDPPKEEDDSRDVQSDTSSDMFGGDAMSIFTNMDPICPNDYEYEGSEEDSEEDSEESEASLYDSDSDAMIAENDSEWTRLVTREQLMVHWNQYLDSSPKVEGPEDWEAAFL
jgi:hypothetical protein